MKILFGHYELCKCLDKLGFVPEKQHGTSHVKFSTPKGHTVPKGSRPFIIVIYNIMYIYLILESRTCKFERNRWFNRILFKLSRFSE